MASGETVNRRHGGVAIVLALVLASVAAVPVAQAATVDPNLQVFVPEPTVEPGSTTALTVQVLNDADVAANTARTAENLRVTLDSAGSPFTVRSGTAVVGDLGDGEVASPTFQVEVPDDVPPGSYELSLTARYSTEYRSIDRTFHPTVRVESRPRFTVVSTEHTARVGDRGTLAVVLENTGYEPARESTVHLSSADAALTFGGASEVSTATGRWPVGETRRVEVPVDFTTDAAVRPYTVDATVDYERPNGVPGDSTLTLSVTPRGAPEFSVSSVEADLRVDARGTVRATVENTGATAARDAVVRLSVPWANGTSPAGYGVGDLGPGESAEVRFATTVPPGTDPGPQRVAFRVEHEQTTGARIVSEPLGASVEVGPRRSAIAVEPVAATFEVDGSGRLEVRLTNRAGGPITDLRATLKTTEPLTSDDASAFVPRLADGESTTVTFHLDVSEDAVPGDHPVSLSFAYDDADGTAQRVSDVPLGVTIVEPSGPGFPVEAVAVVVLAAIAGAVWWYRRR